MAIVNVIKLQKTKEITRGKEDTEQSKRRNEENDKREKSNDSVQLRRALY